jgi:phage baseplate assembly protein W
VSDEIYGRGLSHPLRPGATGLSASSGVRKVEESIRLILGTQYGERLMRPTFGSNLRTLAFAPSNSSTANLARYYVAEGLARWEPRIEVLDVAVETSATQDVHNLVYPFYLEPTS